MDTIDFPMCILERTISPAQVVHFGTWSLNVSSCSPCAGCDMIGRCVWMNKHIFFGGGGSLFIKFGNDDDACVGLCFIKPDDGAGS